MICIECGKICNDEDRFSEFEKEAFQFGVVLKRLKKNNIEITDKIISVYHNTTIGSDHHAFIMKRLFYTIATLDDIPKHHNHIPCKTRLLFLEKLGIDCLRPAGSKPLTKKEIQDKYKQALDNKISE